MTISSDQAPDSPTQPLQRYIGLDVLRGIAVLTIFAVNIKAMAAPFAYYTNASLWSGQYDMIIAGLQAFLIDDKWRAIFTGLYGAGLVLIAEKTHATGASPISRIAQRNKWLLLFGLFHLLFIWIGDILTAYALMGFLAMWFWNKSVKSLWRWAIGLFFIAYIWTNASNLSLLIPEVKEQVLPLMWQPDASSYEQLTRPYLSGNIIDHMMDRAINGINMIIFSVMGGFLLLTLAVMISGMALWKNGFLKGDLQQKTYKHIALLGLGLALITDSIRWAWLVQSNWAFDIFIKSQLLNFFNGFAGAIGYAALIMYVLKTGLSLKPFAMVGRMAFTIYITCSLIGTTITYGHGFAQFGELTNAQLMGIVGISWIVLILFSIIWLSIFRFGPLEWLWRSLSYKKLQPILKSVG